MTLAVQHARTISQTVVRYLPAADVTGWFQWYRTRKFGPAVEQYVSALYEVDITGFSDSDLQMLEQDVRAVAGALNANLYVEHLHGSIDHRRYKHLLGVLNDAADALAEGLSPNPMMRPSEEELMQRLNAMLEKHASPLARTDCAPLGKP